MLQNIEIRSCCTPPPFGCEDCQGSFAGASLTELSFFFNTSLAATPHHLVYPKWPKGSGYRSNLSQNRFLDPSPSSMRKNGENDGEKSGPLQSAAPATLTLVPIAWLFRGLEVSSWTFSAALPMCIFKVSILFSFGEIFT